MCVYHPQFQGWNQKYRNSAALGRVVCPKFSNQTAKEGLYFMLEGYNFSYLRDLGNKLPGTYY